MKTDEEIKIGVECCEKFMNGAPEEECCHVCSYIYNCAELTMDAFAYIKQLEASVPRWIPVEERLPEKYVALKYEYSSDLLVYDGKNIRTAYYFHTTEVWHNAEDEDETVNVTHWMPLPEPQEEE